MTKTDLIKQLTNDAARLQSAIAQIDIKLAKIKRMQARRKRRDW